MCVYYPQSAEKMNATNGFYLYLLARKQFLFPENGILSILECVDKKIGFLQNWIEPADRFA
jgi:hypothetical protein